MIIVDVICLTNTDNFSSYETTNRTINTILDSEDKIKFNIILMESNSLSDYVYHNVSHYIKPNVKFNYNHYLNLASDYLKSEWVLITNDDVKYEKNWFTEILKVYHQDPTIESFSPKEVLFYSTIYADHFVGSKDDYWVSYNVTEAVCGWSLLMRRRVWDEVFPWDENFDFYYQDNDYSKLIESKGIKHALVRNSLTLHLGNLSLLNESEDKSRNEKMEESYKIYLNKWGS